MLLSIQFIVLSFLPHRRMVKMEETMLFPKALRKGSSKERVRN